MSNYRHTGSFSGSLQSLTPRTEHGEIFCLYLPLYVRSVTVKVLHTYYQIQLAAHNSQRHRKIKALSCNKVVFVDHQCSIDKHSHCNYIIGLQYYYPIMSDSSNPQLYEQYVSTIGSGELPLPPPLPPPLPSDGGGKLPPQLPPSIPPPQVQVQPQVAVPSNEGRISMAVVHDQAGKALLDILGMSDTQCPVVEISSFPNGNMMPQSSQIARATNRICREEGCNNNVVNSGVCKLHGAKKRICREEGCNNIVIEGGACKRHGAVVQLCSYDGCGNQVVNSGVCIRHGAASMERKTCKEEGCTNNARSGQEVCVRHGAKREENKLCSHEGCSNKVVNSGVCTRHGAN